MITANVIAHSSFYDSSLGKSRDIATFELEYPRFIHSELMTHRLFSRNAASSRAIPVKSIIEHIRANTAMPSHWGKNRPGMQANEECDAHHIVRDDDGSVIVDWSREDLWNKARDSAINIASIYSDLGYHKQIVNRILEPFVHIKVVVTATDFGNWYWLRNHPDAQPEIKLLSQAMLGAIDESTPVHLREGEWHMPYYNGGSWTLKSTTPLNDALKLSSSCCAQVSYRKLDDSQDKAANIWAKLVEDQPIHASPLEHQATPIISTATQNVPFDPSTWDDGITHVQRDGTLCSGNFRGYIQHRQLVPNHCVW